MNLNEIPAFGCNPATIEEELQKYFGKDFHVKSMKTGYTEEYITKSSDLDCDFDRSEICRWNNSNLDDLDWFIGTGQVSDGGWQSIFLTPQKPQGNFGIAPGDT